MMMPTGKETADLARQRNKLPSTRKDAENFSASFLKKLLTNKKLCAIMIYVVRTTEYAGVAQW